MQQVALSLAQQPAICYAARQAGRSRKLSSADIYTLIKLSQSINADVSSSVNSYLLPALYSWAAQRLQQERIEQPTPQHPQHDARSMVCFDVLLCLQCYWCICALAFTACVSGDDVAAASATTHRA